MPEILPTHQSVLDTLTDVLENFFQTFCGKIVDAIEDEEKGNKSGFPVSNNSINISGIYDCSPHLKF
ncbi:hypothetical protein NQ314_006005 [Rhamnusium bicolor]|uniref:Uncharacterized protein n=1 Tax=Rhamnusium bicolor TaxID=1586634 RepID=A0AAV8ZBT8_9CUCU|nr:hypothetical protein NQ314_006005 [Rhamnusium bicolor]